MLPITIVRVNWLFLGEKQAIATACEALKAAGARRALPLPVGGAFHSPLMEPAKTTCCSNRKHLHRIPYLSDLPKCSRFGSDRCGNHKIQPHRPTHGSCKMDPKCATIVGRWCYRVH